MSTSIIGRIDEMGNRIDDLEKSIGDLMQQVCNQDFKFFIARPRHNSISALSLSGWRGS
jgi:hypothetical protein